MPKIKFIVENQTVEAESGKKLRAIAKDAGISIDREFFRGVNCRGLGLCGSCKVWVKPSSPAAVSAPNLRERIHGMGDGRRLACQTKVLGDVEVTSMAGGDDRLEPKRDIAAPPKPSADPSAARKPVDEGASIAYPLGHPSKVGKGEVPPPEAKAASKPEPAKDKPKAPAKPKEPVASEKPATEGSKAAAAEGDKPKDKPAGQADRNAPDAAAAEHGSGAATEAATKSNSGGESRP